MKKGKYLLLGVISICLCASLLFNVYFIRINQRIKNSIAYSLSDDYLLNQIIITKNTKENERKIVEYAEGVPDTGFNEEWNEMYDDTENTKVIPTFPKINQLPDYPNGCESASATMLLNYFGVKITLKELIENYLPMKEIYTKDGSRYGPDPSLFYAGDPSDKENGWGCYEPVIENTLNRIIFNKKNRFSLRTKLKSKTNQGIIL